MAVIQVYDSGAGGLPADIWCQYRFTGAPAYSVIRVGIQVTPLEAPRDEWNLLGYACIENLDQGVVVIGPQTPIPSIVVGGGATTYLYRAEMKPTGHNNMVEFRGVHWNINRWVGQCRVIIRVFN